MSDYDQDADRRQRTSGRACFGASEYDAGDRPGRLEVLLMSEPLADSQQMLAWTSVLNRIEQSLQQSLSLAAEPATEPPPGQGEGAAALLALDDRLARWQDCLDSAAERTAEAGRKGSSAEEALTEILRRLGAAREKMVNLGKRPVAQG
jgi:hypothetical protein